MTGVDSRDVRQAVLNRDALVYPALRDLMEGGYLDCQHEVAEGERRHVCRLTDKGKDAYLATASGWERLRSPA
jgi:DNA-binding PadR family transcriptional regulator